MVVAVDEPRHEGQARDIVSGRAGRDDDGSAGADFLNASGVVQHHGHIGYRDHAQYRR